MLACDVEYKDLLGKPFRWGARGPDAFDCWGLVMAVFRRAGVDLKDPTEYSDDPKIDGVDIFEKHRRDDEWLPVTDELRPLDVLLFGRSGYDAAIHCAVYVGNHRALQATDRGVISVPFRFQREGFRKAYRHRCLV